MSYGQKIRVGRGRGIRAAEDPPGELQFIALRLCWRMRTEAALGERRRTLGGGPVNRVDDMVTVSLYG